MPSPSVLLAEVRQPIVVSPTKPTVRRPEPYVIGYSLAGGKIEGYVDTEQLSVKLFREDWPDGRPAFRIKFLPSLLQSETAEEAPVTSAVTNRFNLPPPVADYLSVAHGRLDRQKQATAENPRPRGMKMTFGRVTLKEMISSGRTCDVWTADITPVLASFPIIVKLISYRYMPQVAVEALFYEQILPQVLPEMKSVRVPRYVGTYGIDDGGFHAMIMEDVGASVGNSIYWNDAEEMEGGEEASKEAELIEAELIKFGIDHGDITPRNILRGRDDGKLYLIDFGAASLIQ